MLGLPMTCAGEVAATFTMLVRCISRLTLCGTLPPLAVIFPLDVVELAGTGFVLLGFPGDLVYSDATAKVMAVM